MRRQKNGLKCYASDSVLKAKWIVFLQGKCKSGRVTN